MSGSGRRITERLTYANVAATIALFISLGGASYAAISLPPHSVGARQLRTGAVTPDSLSFPLQVRGATDPAVEDLRKGACNSPLRPGEVSQLTCPAPGAPGFLRPAREVHLILRSPGRLLISALAGLEDTGASGTVRVTIHLILDGRVVRRTGSILAGGQQLQAPAQLLIGVHAGSHTVAVSMTASYTSYEPGDVLVSPVSLIVSALPAA